MLPAFPIFNYCRFVATSTGTGSFVVASAAPTDSTGFPHATPATCKAIDGALYRYNASSADGSQTETGAGVYNSAASSIARTTILDTSVGTLTPVNFTTIPIVDVFPNADLALDSFNFTPVQQGGGTGQGTNKVYIGWDGGCLKAQVDASDQGEFLMKSGGQMTGGISALATTSGGIAGPVSSLMVQGAPHAAMAFLSTGVFGCNFLMATDGNFYMGGWSHGTNVYYRFFTTRDPYPLSNGRLAFAADYTHATTSGLAEPYAGAVHTGMSGATFDGGTGSFSTLVVRYRYMQLFTTGWFTVGYV